MKAFLLAAGHGTRLRPITDSIPKCLVLIRGVPMLQIWMEICQNAGIDEVMINLHAHAEAVEHWLRNHRNGITVRTSQEATLLGSAGTVMAHRDWIGSDACFWVLYADVLTSFNLRPMMEVHRERRPIATLGLYRVPDASRCGVASFDEDMVIQEFVEKPSQPTSSWAFSGIMIGTAEMLSHIPNCCPCDFGFDVLPKLAGEMLAYPISDYVLDVGTFKNYEAAQTGWPGLKRKQALYSGLPYERYV